MGLLVLGLAGCLFRWLSGSGGRKGVEWVCCVVGCLTRARINISFRFLCRLCAVMGVCAEIYCSSGSECNIGQCLCSACVTFGRSWC